MNVLNRVLACEQAARRLIFGGLIFWGGLIIFGWAYIRGGGAYIWNEVSVSICGGLIFGGAYIRGGGGAYSRRFTVIPLLTVS